MILSKELPLEHVFILEIDTCLSTQKPTYRIIILVRIVLGEVTPPN